MTTPPAASPQAPAARPDRSASPGPASGLWLCQQRQAHGWTIPQMGRKLREAATQPGDTLPGQECLATMIRCWENGSGVSERYRLHYSRALGIPPEHFARIPAPTPRQPAGNPAGTQPVSVIVLIVRPCAGACPAPLTATGGAR